MKKYLKWNEVPETFKLAPYTWNDVSIIIQVEQIIGGGSSGIAPKEYKFEPIKTIKDTLPKKEYDRFIEIVCNVNGLTTRDLKKRKSEKSPIITIKEIQLTIDTVKASVKISNIEKS